MLGPYYIIVVLRLRESCRVTSGLALSRKFFLTALFIVRLHETRLVPARPVSKGYGIAKLLPLIVPVKRETP
jgi:hypothetical protein